MYSLSKLNQKNDLAKCQAIVRTAIYAGYMMIAISILFAASIFFLSITFV